MELPHRVDCVQADRAPDPRWLVGVPGRAGCVSDARRAGLRVVSNVDVAARTARAIAVGNTPGVLTDATTDLEHAVN